MIRDLQAGFSDADFPDSLLSFMTKFGATRSVSLDGASASISGSPCHHQSWMEHLNMEAERWIDQSSSGMRLCNCRLRARPSYLVSW